MNVSMINDLLALDCVQELLTAAGKTTEGFREELEKELPKPTPNAQWMIDGQPDPFNGRYNCAREELPMGDLTDYTLANECFLRYDIRPSIQELIAGTAKPPIVYMTAMKDRMRWLSFQLAVAQGRVKLKGDD